MEDEIKDVKKTLFRIWTYLKFQKINLIFVIFIVLISTILSVIAPLIMQICIDKFIINSKIKPLLYLLIGLAIIYILKSFLTWIANIVMAKISEKTLYKIREDLFYKLQNLDIGFFDKHQKGDLMSRFTNDVSLISDALTEAIVEIISSIIIIIGTTLTMFMINSILAITTIITVPIFFVIVMKIGKSASDYFMKQQSILGDLTGLSEELISGMKVLKSFNQESNSLKKFEVKNNDLCDVSIKAQIYSGYIMPANAAITNIGNILLIFIGAILVINNKTTVGVILAFLNYSAMFRGPINNVAGLFASLGGALAGAERIFNIMDEPILIKNKKNPFNINKLKGEIAFENVNFRYNDSELILKNINMNVKPGQIIALVGPTGAGKTTIANLLTRFYDINSGNILIDKKNISDYKLEDLRKKIGIVLQDTYLFKGTVKENIMYSKKTNDEEVILASIKANAHDFIHRLPNGYDTLIEDGGSNFSEGEKQLIAIARVILANPDILILDEATSKIDTKTEISVQKGMKELMKNKTSFVIAHRLSTIKDADKILVINNGEIIESGFHEELLKKQGFYYQLYMSQFEN